MDLKVTVNFGNFVISVHHCGAQDPFCASSSGFLLRGNFAFAHTQTNLPLPCSLFEPALNPQLKSQNEQLALKVRQVHPPQSNLGNPGQKEGIQRQT